MTNSNLYGSHGLYSQQSQPRPKTITIDARYKEIYYHAQEEALKESPEAIEHRHIFWNYMMNVSMQNTIVQMAKIA